MVAHISAIVFPAIIAITAVPGSSLFSWHPTLMAIGFSLLMVEGIVIFSKSSTLLPSMSRSDKATLHAIIIGIALMAVFVGFAAIYYNKEINDKPHFTTWHGLLGAITICYMCAQAIGGALAKYYRYVGSYVKIRLADLKLYHATSGLCAFLLVTCTLLLSLYSTWAESNLHWLLWYVCAGSISCSALVIMSQITGEYMAQATRPTSRRS